MLGIYVASTMDHKKATQSDEEEVSVQVLLYAVVGVLIITCGCTAHMQTVQGKQLTVFVAVSLVDTSAEITHNYQASEHRRR